MATIKFDAMKTFIYSRIRGWQSRTWMWIVAIVVSGFAAFYWDATAPLPKSPHEPESVETASTLIPDGYVLVPIEITNFESLDSILGKFGVVDLYIAAPDPGGKTRKIASRLKILRAPLNPSKFAVLVRDADSSRLVSHFGSFIAIVQNSKKSGTGLVNDLQDPAQSGGERRLPNLRRSRISVEVADGKETE